MYLHKKWCIGLRNKQQTRSFYRKPKPAKDTSFIIEIVQRRVSTSSACDSDDSSRVSSTWRQKEGGNATEKNQRWLTAFNNSSCSLNHDQYAFNRVETYWNFPWEILCRRQQIGVVHVSEKGDVPAQRKPGIRKRTTRALQTCDTRFPNGISLS